MTDSRSTWQRLHDIAEARRQHLGMRQRDLVGVSPAWIRGLPERTDAPTARMASSLNELDDALGWPRGTSWKIARDPFEDGSVAATDEEDRLVYGDDSTSVPAAASPEQEQDIRTFTGVVMGTLRNMDEASAERAMSEISRLLGLE